MKASGLLEINTHSYTNRYDFHYEALQFSERNTSYNLRESENKLTVRLPRTNYCTNSFSYKGVLDWTMSTSTTFQF